MVLILASEPGFPSSDSNYHQFNVEGIIEQNEIAYKDNHSTSTAKIPNSIIIFVSFSMPPSSLKSWLNDAQMIGAHVAIRGLVNNSFKETLNAFTKITDDEKPAGLQIDPELFNDFSIEQVPAVVSLNRGECNGDNHNCSPYSSYDVIKGNTSMRYALEKLYEQGDIRSEVLKLALEKLGES